jgi:hypothetical protein
MLEERQPVLEQSSAQVGPSAAPTRPEPKEFVAPPGRFAKTAALLLGSLVYIFVMFGGWILVRAFVHMSNGQPSAALQQASGAAIPVKDSPQGGLITPILLVGIWGAMAGAVRLRECRRVALDERGVLVEGYLASQRFSWSEVGGVRREKASRVFPAISETPASLEALELLDLNDRRLARLFLGDAAKTQGMETALQDWRRAVAAGQDAPAESPTKAERFPLAPGLRLLGILALILGGFGIAGNALKTTLALSAAEKGEYTTTFGDLSMEVDEAEARTAIVWHGADGLLAAGLMVAAVGLLNRRRWGRSLALMVAAGQLVSKIATAALFIYSFQGATEGLEDAQAVMVRAVGVLIIFLNIALMVFPIALLWILGRPSARRAFE